MRWYKYTIHTTQEAEEMITALLSGLGVDALEIEDRMPHGPEESGNLFGDVVPTVDTSDHTAAVSFYLEAEEKEEDSGARAVLLTEIQKELNELREYMDIGEGTISSGMTEETEWIDRWKEYFHRFFVDDIEVIPSWEEEVPSEEASMVLRIDPGTAFGTGKHETTQLAIRGLRKYLKEGDALLDIGTGSGILGIIALKSGASFVYGTDIDPVAFPALADNLVKNNIQEDLFLCSADNLIVDDAARKKALAIAEERRESGVPSNVKRKKNGGYQVITANIIAEILVELTPVIPSLLCDGGIYITSGILLEKADLVRNAMEGAGLRILEVRAQGEWCSIVAVKEKQYRFFSHRKCEYFPCHPGADPENFNCLFCYCPLHFLGTSCPGNPRILENGVKDCTNCTFPHKRENYDKVIAALREHKYFGTE